MYPTILGIRAYSLFFYIACISTIVISLIRIHRRDININKAILVIILMSLAVPIGARILNIITNYEYFISNPKGILDLRLRYFSLMGGLIVASIIGFISSIALKISPWKLADSIAPGLTIGLALIRVGCFLNGCCFGKPTNMPWGIRLPTGSPAFNHYFDRVSFSITDLLSFSLYSPPIHPTQLYEMIAAIFGVLIIKIVDNERYNDGTSFLVFSIYFSIFRWINMYLRAPIGTLSDSIVLYNYVYILITLISTIILIYRNKSLYLAEKFSKNR